MLSKNEQKFIKSLKVKKYRTREKCFLVEGTKNVLELLKSDFQVRYLVATESFLSFSKDLPLSLRFEEVKPGLLSQLGSFKTNDEVMAVVQMREIDSDTVGFEDYLFVLDGISDPGNLGTIIRTLDWFGFDQVVCSHECAEFYNPKVISSTMGSFTRVKVFYKDLMHFMSSLDQTIPIYPAIMDGKPLNSLTLNSKGIIVMGSESHGVSPAILELSNLGITIPKVGSKTESLNVGVSTGIIAHYLRTLR